MEIYKSKKPFIVNEKDQFAKNQIFVVKDNNVYVQGRTNKLNYVIFNEILSMGVLENTTCEDEFINDNVIPNNDYKKIKEVVKKSHRVLSDYSKQLKTIERWAFKPKGSSSSKIEHEIEFQNNPEEVLKNTILREGMKSKPGDVYMNRGTERHGPFVTEEDSELWLLDDTTILPYGIRKNDYATQSEQVKIYKKLIQQVCSMEDCPQIFIDFFKSELGIKQQEEPFRDYLPLIDKKTRKNMGKPKLFFKDFDKNQHHSKEKGLELCHLDPWDEFSTNVNNITIGSSRANRLQGGSPIWFIKKSFE